MIIEKMNYSIFYVYIKLILIIRNNFILINLMLFLIFRKRILDR